MDAGLAEGRPYYDKVAEEEMGRRRQIERGGDRYEVSLGRNNAILLWRGW